jgi:hypothetical protein
MKRSPSSILHRHGLLRPTLYLWACILFPTVLATDTPERAVRGPAWVAGCLAWYEDFDGEEPTGGEKSGEASPTAISIRSGSPRRTVAEGLIGKALDAVEKPLVLEGDSLSPHRPLTISFWWALPRDLPVDGTFNLFQLTGRGIIAAFTRGKGEWCALEEPAGVLQVYYFPGIQNHNGIYDPKLSEHLELRAGVWHHTAAVFRRASTVELYTDGALVAEATTVGRELSQEDAIRSLSLGGGVLLDEVLILDRALDAERIADYRRGMRRLHEYRR